MSWKEAIKAIPKNMIFQGVTVLILMTPLVATIGQFWSTGFLSQRASVALLFWPGAKWSWTVQMYGWIIMGIFIVTYLWGIGWMLRRRTLGKVILWGIAVMIVANILGSAVNYLTGWKELQQMDSMNLAGKVNRAILASWHNPLWEEIVFRGLPLLIIIPIRKRLPKHKKIIEWCYMIIPSVVMAIYHIPGHGPSRIVDTIILAVAFAWLTLRFSFFAPMVLHYIFDITIIISLGTMKNVPLKEARWLVDNAPLLNTAWSISILALLGLIPSLIIWNKFLHDKLNFKKSVPQ